MTASPLSREMLQRLAPISALGPESLAQVARLARTEVFPRQLRSVDYRWHRQVVYLLKGELMLDYPNGGRTVVVGGHDPAFLPLGRSGIDPVNVRPITDVELVGFDENALDILVTWDQVASNLQASPEGDGQDVGDWRALPGIYDAGQLTRGAFANLPAANIDALLACFKRHAVKKGEVIVRQHAPGDYYYVIERGRAVVTREVAGAQIELAELKSGDAFGEEALIAETTRNATVTMKTDGELLRLDGADFIRLLRAPLLKSVTAGEARQREAMGTVWLDVRFPAEYRQDGLRGAINIPLNELRNALPSLGRDKEYIVYCQTGRRSSAAAFLMSQRGLRACLLAGGLKAMNGSEKETA